MLHGPCGVARPHSPCMVNGKCSKHFPKKFSDRTYVDDDGYPKYRRRDSGLYIEKNGVPLDNRYVVPYNPWLLRKYHAHINVEWCNQARSIKYLFKYVNKGNDRVTIAFHANEEHNSAKDEIKMYYDCRYVSPCEAIWRLFGWDIQYRYPPVERLSIHLENEQSVSFDDDSPLDEVMTRDTVHKSQFLSWLDANKKYIEGKELTYVEYPNKFTYKKSTKDWNLRKKGFSIGRLYFVPLSRRELYYMRILVGIIRGPEEYKDLRTIDGKELKTFEEACYFLGLIDNDKEYVDGIKEASIWATGDYLRKLFASLLLSNSMSRPDVVWNDTWEELSEDILYKQRIIHNNKGIFF